jgi:hypothetical protein
MTKGIIVLAQNTKETNYVKQACLLAMSLRVTNPNTKISIVTNHIISKDYKCFFDKVIKIPWSDNAKTSKWKVENRWKLYHITPYDETIVLDTDMLVLQNIDSWWNFLSNYDLFFTSRVETYRGETITNDYYRKTFTANNLPNLYSGLYYFKKCEKSHEFFAWLELVMNNWELFYGKYAKEYYNKWLSVDVSAAIVAKILDIDSEITNKRTRFPTFTHMKPMIQGWKEPTAKWQDAVGIYFSDDCKLKIGNYQQYGIFHYTEKNFVKDEIIDIYRNYLNVR